MRILGLHHVTVVTSDAERTLDFYGHVLGLRHLATTGGSDPSGSRLFFAAGAASPGSLLTFVEQPDADLGLPGIGGTHHVALRVADRDGLMRWKRRVSDYGRHVRGPYDRHYFTSIYFRGPDSEIIEVATAGPGLDADRMAASGAEVQPQRELTRTERDAAAIAAETWPEPVSEIVPSMRLEHGLHHLSATSSDVERTHDFLGAVLGLSLVKRTFNYDDPDMPHWYWGFSDDPQGTLVTYFGVDPTEVRRARPGRGQTHHYALTVGDEDELHRWRERLLEAGLPVEDVPDGSFVRGIRTRDPDGHLVELAARGLGLGAG